MKSNMKRSSVAGKFAIAASGIVFAACAGAASPTNGFWGSSVAPWPMSVDESSPSRSIEQVRPQHYESPVGATGGQSAGGSRSSSGDHGSSTTRNSPFPSSVDESYPSRIGRE